MFEWKWYLVHLLEYIMVYIFLCHLSIPWEKNRVKIIFAILIPVVIANNLEGTKYAMLVNHTLTIGSLVFVFRRKLKDSLMDFICIFILGNATQLPLVLSLSFFPNFDIYTVDDQIILMLLNVIIAFIFCRAVPFKSFINKHRRILERSAFILVALYLLAYVSSILINHYHDENWILIDTIGFAFILVIFAMFQSILESKEEQFLIHSYQSQKNMLLPLLDEIRSKQHDFKNHLTTIYGYCQNQNQETVENIEKYIHSVHGTLQDMDILIRVKDKVLGAIVYSKACEAKERNIEFEYDVPPYEVSFPFKEHEYTSIVGNLLDNAFDALPDGNTSNRIKLLLDIRNDVKYLEVWNNGTPISPEDIRKIFRKGFSTKKSQFGRGFGLYNVKKITESYGGTIEVGEKNGFTVFSICFPV